MSLSMRQEAKKQAAPSSSSPCSPSNAFVCFMFYDMCKHPVSCNCLCTSTNVFLPFLPFLPFIPFIPWPFPTFLLSFLDAPPLTHTIQSPWCCVQSLLSYLPPSPSRPLFFPSFSFPPFLILVLFLLLPSYSSPSPISSIIPPSLPPLPFPSLPSFFFSSSVILPDIPYPLLPLHPLHAPLHTTLLLINSTKRWRTRVSFPSILPTPRLAFTSDSNTTTINFQGYTFLQLHSSSLILAIHSFLSTFPPSFFPYLLPFISPFLSSSSLHLSLLATRHSSLAYYKKFPPWMNRTPSVSAVTALLKKAALLPLVRACGMSNGKYTTANG